MKSDRERRENNVPYLSFKRGIFDTFYLVFVRINVDKFHDKRSL